ncbi:cell surface glycoprotein CD200 receptor 1-A [Synchiropus splendidus]|uniref:cell surface glycoprotein CD200 receptor 1-A n=1 Tax=Synchiropus splendidus TaxID=270530 RepID=UPI00237EB215|nr:cell surface glycoprotein CD200 receptor 1-A [Synchiropus splendidus]
MMESVWIFTVLIIYKAWSVTSEVPLSFELGSYVNLTCRGQSNPFLHVIWKIQTKNNKCRVTFQHNSENTCRDGLYITLQATNQTVLHIPNFSESDVGFYSGELVLSRSREVCNFSLSVTTPPRLSSWLEMKDGKLVAVCKAEGANPAANISWKEAGNSSVEEKRSVSDQFHTTESRLTLPQHYASSSTPVCSVAHAAWAEERLLLPRLPGLPFYQVCIISAFITIFVLAGTSLLLYRHRKFLISRCRGHVDASLTDSQQKEDVEEVEPYASYVQRVNSIYNS